MRALWPPGRHWGPVEALRESCREKLTDRYRDPCEVHIPANAKIHSRRLFSTSTPLDDVPLKSVCQSRCTSFCRKRFASGFKAIAVGFGHYSYLMDVANSYSTNRKVACNEFFISGLFVVCILMIAEVSPRH